MSLFADVSAFPLTWPAGWSRTRYPKRWPGDHHSVHRGTRAVLDELVRLGARESNVIVSTNLRLRLDGLPYSSQCMPEDRGTAVYFPLKGEPHVLACDRWDQIGCNLWAIARHVEALRGMDRWGVGSLEQAFRGYAALPDPNAPRPWWDVLGVNPGATADQVRARFRELAKAHHPDRGGDPATMAELSRARDEALALLRV